MNTSLLNRASSLVHSFSRLALASRPSPSPFPSSSAAPSASLFQPAQLLQVRNKALVPRRTKYRKAHKGRTPLALGGSTKGTVLESGDYGLRVNEAVRLSAKHLEVAEAALKRGLKPIRGSKVYARFFRTSPRDSPGARPDPPQRSQVHARISRHSRVHQGTIPLTRSGVASEPAPLTEDRLRYRVTRPEWARARGPSSTGPAGEWSPAPVLRSMATDSG